MISKTLKIGILIAAIGLIAPLLQKEAEAVFLVDTGVPVVTDPGIEFEGYDLYADEWLSGEFSVGSPSIITDISMRLGGFYDPDTDTTTGGIGTFTIVLYSDGGDVPGSELFTQQVSVAAAPLDWKVFSGLNWSVPSGTYWLAAEIRGSDTFFGRWQGGTGSSFLQIPPPFPLENEAYNFFGGAYVPYDSLDVALRIEDNSNVIPEPLTMATIGFGLLGGGLVRRKIKK